MDDYVYHKSNELKNLVEDVRTNGIMIPPHHASCVQSIDVGFNKFMKDQLNATDDNWEGLRDSELSFEDGITTLKREDILE